MDLSQLATASGLSERYIRENRDRLEQCLQRRVGFKDRANKNRLMFEPEAVELFKAWQLRKTDESFADEFRVVKTVEAPEVIEFEPEVTTAIVHRQDAPIDAEFVEELQLIIPRPIEDAQITTSTVKAEMLARAIVAADEQTELNRRKQDEAEEEQAYQRGYERTLRIAAKERQGTRNAEDFISDTARIAQLERQLAEVKAKQGGDAKASTKSRKR